MPYHEGMSESESPKAIEPVVEVVEKAPPSTGRGILALVGGLIGGLYLLNPTAGLIELIPDNVPIIGNLDEAAATALLIFAIREVGRNLFPDKD